MEEKKILGDFPPSSMLTGTRLSAAFFMMSLPVLVSPVNANLATFLFEVRASPASSPKPVTTLTTPAGMTSFSKFIKYIMEVGVCSAGLSTMVFPAASAGASFQAAIRRGKFQGMMRPTTPRGSWMIMERVSASISEALPSSARITPAKYRKWSITRGRSAATVSRIALPLSMDSRTARVSACCSIMSAILSSMLERSVTDTFFQLFSASLAESTAMLISFWFDRAALMKGRPSIGEILSKYCPSMGSSNFPLMKLP
mmetsp:Transcript_15520/g.25861  ORF Transcript_15520/g.25861 Transcript_15520/m.25861 type:complete len:257 (-) Transcript_15520:145-915(-)